ncbi:MAG: hypothetical protein V4857_05725 [Pseudomonadota bacterium]
MKIGHVSRCAALLLSLVSAATFATAQTAAAAPEAAVAAAAPAGPAAVPAPAAPKGTLAERQLPKLVMRWDCGDCKQNDKVLPLIEKNYETDAVSAGYTISDSETAELAITAYRQRNPGMRVMFGIMAGKDVLNTRVTFRNKEFLAKDYSANAFQGMNNLCADVSKKVMQQLVLGLQAP